MTTSKHVHLKETNILTELCSCHTENYTLLIKHLFHTRQNGTMDGILTHNNQLWFKREASVKKKKMQLSMFQILQPSIKN